MNNNILNEEYQYATLEEKRLNAKPCGILDSAHMTHGLNP